MLSAAHCNCIGARAASGTTTPLTPPRRGVGAPAIGRPRLLLNTPGSSSISALVAPQFRHTRCQAQQHTQVDSQQHPSVHAVAAGVFASLAVLTLSAGAPAAHANPVFEGPARIVDGDTLYIGKEKVRLFGIDAPEKGQMCSDPRGQPYACGMASLEALKQRVGNRPVRCEVKNKDQYQRNVAACSIAPDLPFQQPEDIGTFMVREGFAVAYRAYGKEYVPVEDQAHAKHRGIWAGDFTEPALWRKQQKAATLNASLASTTPPPPQQQQQHQGSGSSSVGAGTGSRPSYAAVAAGAAAAGGGSSGSSSSTNMGQLQPQQVAAGPSAGSCNGPLIKGNINSKGQKIYHTVSNAQYPRVIIDESVGEKFFCTEEEAAAAGWQPAKK